MSKEEVKVRRTLQMRFTLPATDTSHYVAMIKAAAPFYQAFGNAQVRLLQNVDDPAKFVQEIEYEADEGWELNRQRLAGDIACRHSCKPGGRCSPERWRWMSIRSCDALFYLPRTPFSRYPSS